MMEISSPILPPLQYLAILMVSFSQHLISNVNLVCCNWFLLLLVLLLCNSENCLATSLPSDQVVVDSNKIHLEALSTSSKLVLTSPSSVSPSLYILCSSPKNVSVAITNFGPVYQCLFCTGNPQIGHNNPDVEGHNHFPQSDGHAPVTMHLPCRYFPCSLSIPYRPEG